MSFISSSDTAITAINNVLVQEANRINTDVHRYMLHRSPWIELTKQEAFPDGMGYQLNTLIYDRALPATSTAGNAIGVNWHSFQIQETANQFNTSLIQGNNPLDDSTKQTAGPSGGDTDLDNDFDSNDGNSGDVRSFVNFSRKLKSYALRRAVVESPKVNIEDLRFAAHRNEQLRACVELLAEVTQYSWEERYREEYERLAANFVPCLTTSTPILTTVDGDADGTADDSFEGETLTDGLDLASSGASNADVTPTGNISNAVLDKIYMRLIRAGAGRNAHGMENARPIFSLVLSSEASYRLQTAAGFRDDVRYNQARVSELIQPLGVEKSWRGFYHLVDDNTPRFTESGGALTRVLPQTMSSGIVTQNDAAYEAASYEAAYVLHSDVFCSQVPNPVSGSQGLSFDPVAYRGQFKWTNIPDIQVNPDGTIGFFRGILAAASKPVKTDFGYVILFKRDSGTDAAV